MEILEAPRDTKLLKDVAPGETFVLNNIVYMKTHSGGTLNAVGLTSGGLNALNESTPVYPVVFIAQRK